MSLREFSRIVGSILWTVSPLATFGIATAIIFPHAASRLRTWWFVISAVFWVTAVVAWLTVAGVYGSAMPEPQYTIVGLLSVVTMLGGSGHAFLMGKQVFNLQPPRMHTPPIDVPLCLTSGVVDQPR